MVHHSAEATSPVTTPTTSKTPITTNDDNDNDDYVDDDTLAICRTEHVFHAFDALYCSLTHAHPVKPLFPDDK
jgi:hypothetical protein